MADLDVLPDWPAGTVAVLATGGGGGAAPGAIPVSTAIRAGDRRLLFALAPRRASLAALRADPRCALAVVAEGLAVTVHGRAEVLDAGRLGNVVAVALHVDRIQDHGSHRFEIEAGVRWRWTDPEAEARDAEVRAGLAELKTG